MANKTLPYHEWLLKAIKEASFDGIRELAPMVKEVTIPIGHHDEIIDAWCKKLGRLGLDDDFNVPASVLRQMVEAGQKAKEKRADAAFVAALAHDGEDRY